MDNSHERNGWRMFQKPVKKHFEKAGKLCERKIHHTPLPIRVEGVLMTTGGRALWDQTEKK